MSSRPKRKRAWRERAKQIFDLQQKEEIIRKFMSSPLGRPSITSSLIAPIRNRLDYQAVGRRTFLIDQMPDLPKCGQCGGLAGQNASQGCRECMAREIMDL